MSLTMTSKVYKPFQYPWAYTFWQEQQRMHWLAQEVPMGSDVKDWNTNMTPEETNLLSNIFRFFTQGDIEVNECYMDKYSQIFKPVEIKMMLSAISNTETIHIDAYSHLLDTLGIPEEEYRAFLEYEQMMNKIDMLEACSVKDPWDVAETMGVYAAFTEGLQLFASFAILLNFPRHNKMKGMGQIVTWSVRDETLHVEAIMKLYHTYLDEHPEIDRERLTNTLTRRLKQVIENEDKFIDLCFEMGGVKGMEPDDVKKYIRYIADIRCDQLGIPKQYFIEQNPLPWLDEMLNGMEHTNFFEQQATEYNKAATEGEWDDDIYA